MNPLLAIALRQAAFLAGVVLFCMGLLAASNAEAASDSHQIGVQATVLSKNKCHFMNGGPTLLNFNSIDPSSQSDYQSAVTIELRCQGSSAIATYGVSDDDGQYASGPNAPRMQHSTQGGAYLPYQLSYTASGSVPRNTIQTMTLTGTITPSGFANALAGTYADTVTLTISP